MKNAMSLKLGALLLLSVTMGCLLPQSYAATEQAQAVGPADNFYAWANREWLETATIPADQPRVDNFTVIEDIVLVQLRDLVMELKAAKVRTPDQEKLVRLYDSFVDMAKRDEKGLAPIAGELAKIDGLGTHSDIARHFAYLQTVGVSTPVIIVPEADARDSSMNIGIIAQAGLGIERDYYLGSDAQSLQQQKLYRDYLAKLFGLAGLSKPDARADQVLALERKLAAIQWSQVQNRDMQKTYNPTNAKAFVAEAAEFYGEALMQVWGAPGDASLSIRQPSYISAYGPLFHGTPVSAWQDYARARLLLTYAVLLTSEFKAANAQYQQDLGLVQEEEALWKQGIGFVGDATNMMLGRAYVEKYYDAQTRAAVTELVLSIRDAYSSSFEEATWMSDETRRKAIAKLDKMQFKIGYPDHWQDYSSLEIPGTDLAENFRRVSLFDHKRSMEKIGRPVNRNDWDNSPHEVNAFYDPTRNEFVLLAAILQPPFYDEKGNAAAKYGGMGFVVGHEIGHGFDDQGSLYDGDGNLVNWWTDADAKAYGMKKQKLIAQADAYEILPGTFLKGEQEIGEIMGDLSGAQIAMKAYKQTPGASDAAFFSQLAQTWRSKWRDEFLKMVIQRDVHPPSEFRANGIVKQFDAFYEAYDVKPEDKMYLAPQERVLMW